MHKNFQFDPNNLRIFYLTYKDYFVPILTIVFAFLLLIFVVVPQYQDYFDMKKTIDLTQQKIEGLEGNLNYLSKLNTAQEQQNFQTVTFALPSDKDFIGVLQAISKASRNSFVSVGDFSFLVGDLSNKAANGQQSFNLSLNVTGSVVNIRNFINELSEGSPVSEVSSVEVSKDTAKLNIAFYYTPVPRSLQIDFESPLPIPTAKDKALIESLRAWQEGSSVPVASSSATH